MTWRPPNPYTVVADPTLWTPYDLRTLPDEQKPPVVTEDHWVETGQGRTVVRVGPAYDAAAVHAGLDQGDGFGMARVRGRIAENRRRLGEGRWVPPRRDVAAARVLIEQGWEAALARAQRTELCWDTRLCHGLLQWQWARDDRGADRLRADLTALAHHMTGEDGQLLEIERSALHT